MIRRFQSDLSQFLIARPEGDGLTGLVGMNEYDDLLGGLLLRRVVVTGR